MFFGLTLNTGKTEMIRAVAEGICYHLRWMLECQDRKTRTSDTLRFSGGSALSDVTSQILADITGRRVEVPGSPQYVGSVGAALTAAVGLGLLPDLEQVADMIPAEKTFDPQEEFAPVYNRNYEVFKKLYQTNKKNYEAMSMKTSGKD